jgi:hypothetical protein
LQATPGFRSLPPRISRAFTFEQHFRLDGGVQIAIACGRGQNGAPALE